MKKSLAHTQPLSTTHTHPSIQTRLTFQCLALNQIKVIRLLQDSALESTAQTLQVAAVDVKHETSHFQLVKRTLFARRSTKL